VQNAGIGNPVVQNKAGAVPLSFLLQADFYSIFLKKRLA
jgi:hypothetical protein